MIDVGIVQGDGPYLWKMGALLILLGIVGFSFSLTAQYFAAKSAISMGMALRRDLFAHINTLSYREIDAIGTSTLINRMTNDVNQVQNGFNMFLRLFLRSPFVVLGAMIMAFTVNLRAASPFAVTIPVLLAVVFAILLSSMRCTAACSSSWDRVLLSTRENLLGIRVVRAFARQEEEQARFRREADGLYRRQIFVGKISALLNPLTYVHHQPGHHRRAVHGRAPGQRRRPDPGAVIALINYMSQILTELIKLANLIIVLSRALASLARVNAVFAVQPSQTDTGADPPPPPRRCPPSNLSMWVFAYAGAERRRCTTSAFPSCPAEPGHHRRHRFGQVHPGPADPAVLRLHCRHHPPVWGGYQKAAPLLHPPAGGDRPAKGHRVLRHAAQKHAMGQAGRHG